MGSTSARRSSSCGVGAPSKNERHCAPSPSGRSPSRSSAGALLADLFAWYGGIRSPDEEVSSSCARHPRPAHLRRRGRLPQRGLRPGGRARGHRYGSSGPPVAACVPFLTRRAHRSHPLVRGRSRPPPASTPATATSVPPGRPAAAGDPSTSERTLVSLPRRFIDGRLSRVAAFFRIARRPSARAGPRRWSPSGLLRPGHAESGPMPRLLQRVPLATLVRAPAFLLFLRAGERAPPPPSAASCLGLGEPPRT
jgi:hypothetical protein